MTITTFTDSPSTFRADAILPSLTVRDLAVSVSWYRDVAGFALIETWERDGRLAGAVLAAGEIQLWISQDDGQKGLDRRKGEGCSLTFRTSQDIDVLAERIAVNGGILDTLPTDMPWGARIFQVRDPDGFRLAFMRKAR